jgi:uncharacterized protein involved in exopolysaccharide biosynthesis
VVTVFGTKANPLGVFRHVHGLRLCYESEVYTVGYEAMEAMLLNEFLKERREVQELEAALAKQKEGFRPTAEERQKEIKALTAGLKQTGIQIQKVSAPLTIVSPWRATQVVDNNQSSNPNLTSSTHKEPSRLIAWWRFVFSALPDSCSTNAILLVQKFL